MLPDFDDLQEILDLLSNILHVVAWCCRKR